MATIELGGKATNQAGTALEGLTVELWTAANWETPGSATSTTTTDSDGLWAFSSVAEGTHIVVVNNADSTKKILFDGRNEVQFTRVDVRTLIQTDTINEATSASGVTIDGLLVRDSAIPISGLDIDGGTDIGAALVDADLMIVDDGAGGTNRKSALSRMKTYVGASAGAFAIANLDIDGGTDIGAALVDADLIVVDDGAGGTNRKSALSRFLTYTAAGVATLTNKTFDASGTGNVLTNVGASEIEIGIITGHTELSAGPAETDELLISDAGTFKKINANELLNPENFTELSAAPASSDEVFINDGGTGKKITVDNLTSYYDAATATLTNKTFDANGTGNSLSNVDVADLANGTDGELITWDANAAPATVAAGTSGQVLTSNGAGAAPTFQAAASGVALSGSTNNTIATVTGANALIGEANLVFDGSELSVGASPPSGSTINATSTGVELIRLQSTAGTADGPYIRTIHNSASPADNDEVLSFFVQAKDDGATVRSTHFWQFTFEDVTSTTMDSKMKFVVMDNVNAANAGTTATLTSVGVWTDASAEIDKTYEGSAMEIWGGRDGCIILDKIMQLNVGRYHSSHQPATKPIRERHISPTAEQFWDIFQVGRDPRVPELNKDGIDVNTPGLAPKDIAGVALMGIQELNARVNALAAQVIALGGAI
tara:strand:- start:2277 stop:4265 length:1989 start_codon:yes stop_codon:yes gene_type:complete